MLSVVILSVVMLSVVMLSVVMLSDVSRFEPLSSVKAFPAILNKSKFITKDQFVQHMNNTTNKSLIKLKLYTKDN